MFILLRNIILSNIWWVLLASTVVSGFASGLIVHKWHQARELSALKQAAEKRESNDEKARTVASDIDKLPIGASAERLFIEWGRNTD